MQFWKAKFWVLWALLALVGPVSPIFTASVCASSAAPMGVVTAAATQKMTPCAQPCGKCCKAASPQTLWASLSAPLPSSVAPRSLVAAPGADVEAILPAIFVLEVPATATTKLDFVSDLPPPRTVIGSSRSCRAPPFEA